MPQLHDVGRLYCGLQYHPKYTPFRVVERSSSVMNEAPWRLGSGIILRFPGVRYGIILGYWWGHGSEDSVPQGMEILGDRTEEVRDWVRPEEGDWIEDLPFDEAMSRFNEIAKIEREL